MIFRQNIFSVIFLRKELLFLFVVVLSLGSGWYELSSGMFVESHAEDIWKVKDTERVKGASDSQREVSQHFVELEVQAEKYVQPRISQFPKDQDTKWGIATQVDEYTWTMNVEHDQTMASASEIVDALNVYRQTKGKTPLQFDQTLADYAQNRANFFVSQNGMDSHAGFQHFINNEDGFGKLGFFALGENSSFGYQLTATHLIEWVFAGDAPHDNNQLNPEWTHIGVGVSGVSIDIIFGGRKQ